MSARRGRGLPPDDPAGTLPRRRSTDAGGLVMRGTWFALWALATVGASIGLVDDRPARRLTEFGWDEPDAAFLREHIAAMERTPFDGCVFHVNAAGPDGKAVNFTWAGWGRRAFAEAELAAARADLEATPLARFTHNFLR